MIENEFIETSPQELHVRLVVDQSLLDYFREGMVMDHIAGDARNELVAFLANILNDTSYPIQAFRSGEQEIRLGYQIRPFADPIF